MATITILIEGIGLIYEKLNAANPELNRWKILFPFDSQHRVNFIWREAGHTNNQSMAMEGAQINISVSDPKETSTHQRGAGYEYILDINEAHNKGIKLKENWQESGAVLSIPNAKLSCPVLTKSTFLSGIKKVMCLFHLLKLRNQSAIQLKLKLRRKKGLSQ